MTTYREWVPPVSLQPFIECFWEAHHEPEILNHHYVLPDGCEDLLFRQQDAQLAVEVVGLMTQGKCYGVTCAESLWGIRFRGGQLQAFLGHRPQDYVNATVPLLAEYPTLARQWQRSPLDAQLKSQVLQWLLQHGENLKPQVINAALSQRQLQRRHKACTGVSFQTLQSIWRFRKVWESLEANPHQSLLPLALRSGYSDQSHMSRDFKRLANITPTTYVAFLQDAGGIS